MSDALLIFRGEVAAKAAGELIVDALSNHAHATRLAISGPLTAATLRIARLAGRHVEESVLIEALQHELQLDHGLTSSLIARLIAANVLSAEVKATTRLSFSGHSEIASELSRELTSARWPADLAGLEIAVLGTLGSSDWYRELASLRARNVRVLTCSFEGARAWIGPLLAPGQPGPCPLCLLARRIAAGAEDSLDVSVSFPPSLALVAGLLLQVAEQCARGELEGERVLAAEGTTSSWHSLLAQPHCTLCDPRHNSFRALGAQREAYARELEAELARGEPSAEPTEAQRSAFLDPLLGPLSLEIHDAPATFRELPLVLGSIRTARRGAHGFTPRALSSVMFGTGASERRRVLVAFAEGIERYAGVTDEPDVTNVPYRELAGFAVAPEDTVRFSEQQYTSGVRVRHTQQPLDWSWVYDWTAGSAKLLLSDAVSYARDPAQSGVQLFEDPFSSGMSAHRSLALALERSLFELVERDAFMLAWYLRLPLAELDISLLEDTELHDLRHYLEAAGITLRFHDLRVDFAVPTVLAVAEARRDFGPWKRGGKILSACAGKTFRDAVRHALRELLGHYTAYGLVSPDGDKSIDADTGEARPWWPAFAALLSPQAEDPLAFLAHGLPRLHVEDTASSTLSRAEFLRRGLSVYVRRLGRRDIAQSGLVAIRAVIPGLVRLTPDRDSVNFGEPRFEQMRLRWNADSGLNPRPHPLA